MPDPPALPPRRDVTRYGEGAAVPWTPAPATGAPPVADDEIRLDELWAIISRNRWLILGSVLVALAAAVLYNLWATPVYEAAATIRIEEPAKNPLADNPLIGLTGQDELETEMEVLRSYAFAERVVDSLDLQVEVGEPKEYTRDQVFASVAVAENAHPGSYVLDRQDDHFVLETLSGRRLGKVIPGQAYQLEEVQFTLSPNALEEPRILFHVRGFGPAVDRLKDRLSIERIDPDVSIIRVRYQGPDRDLTPLIPNQFAELFLVQRRGEHKTEASSTVAFLEEQIDSIAVRLTDAEEEQREFQEEERVVSLEAEGESRIAQMATLQGRRDVYQAEQSSLGRLLQEAEQAPDDPTEPSPYRRLVSFPSLIATPTTSSLLSSLVELENQQSELMTRRTVANPDVQALATRIDQIEEQLHSVASAYHRGISGQVSSLESSLGRESGILSRIPRKQVQMARLQRETQLLQEVYTLLQTRLKEAEIAEAVKDPSARVVDRAAIRGGPIRPRPLLNLALALFLGMVAGFGAALVREYRDKTLQTRDDIRAITSAPVLALIPRFDEREALAEGKGRRLGKFLPINEKEREPGRSLVVATDSDHAAAEAYRSLRTNLTFTSPEHIPRTVLLTSALPRDGKTTSSVNLAHVFAQQGMRVLLVDADMRRGEIHRLFGLARDPGLSNVLIEELRPEDAIRTVGTERGLELDVLTAGAIPPNPSELLGSRNVKALVELLNQRYEQIIWDTPPLTVVTDAAVLAPLMDSVLVVVRAEYTEDAALAFAMEQLGHVQAPVKGIVLNDIDPNDTRYGGYYSYGYRYRYYGTERAGRSST